MKKGTRLVPIMQMIQKAIVVLFSLFVLIIVSRAQNRSMTGHGYQTESGSRFGMGEGITIKHFISPNHALEGIGYFGSREARITGLYEIHGPISVAAGLRWCIGPGVHLGFYNSKNGNDSFTCINGVPGPDYKFNGAPINMSLDWQPSFEFDDGRGFSGSWGGPVYLLIYILSFISKKRKGSIIYGPFLFYILLRNQWI